MRRFSSRRAATHGPWVALLLLAMLTVPALVAPAKAAYPTKAIDIIVPFAPGGGTDVVARISAEYVRGKWKQSVNVVNKPGGGGTPGTVETLQAKPDGYTLTMLSASTSFLNPALQTDLPYKWSDLTYIARLVLSPLVLVVKADAPFNTTKDLVEAIRKDPSKFKAGSSGLAGPSTFGIAQLLQSAGIDPTTVDIVPFNGGAPTLTAVAGGHVQFAAQNMSEVLPLIEGKKLKPLAVSTPERDPSLPSVPTAKEAGYPGFIQVGVFGMAGPPNLPEAIVGSWEAVLSEAMKDAGYVDKLKKSGNIPSYQGAKEYRVWTGEQFKSADELATKLKLKK